MRKFWLSIVLRIVAFVNFWMVLEFRLNFNVDFFFFWIGNKNFIDIKDHRVHDDEHSEKKK